RVVRASCDATTDRERHRGGQYPKQQVFTEVLVKAHQGVALEQVGLAVLAELLDRGVVLVVRDRGRHVAHPVPEQVETPAEVDVLVKHEEPLVETADLAV